MNNKGKGFGDNFNTKIALFMLNKYKLKMLFCVRPFEVFICKVSLLNC